jgi:hypothetical protein
MDLGERTAWFRFGCEMSRTRGRLWVSRTVSRLWTRAFAVAQADVYRPIADQHGRPLWPFDSPTSCSEVC